MVEDGWVKKKSAPWVFNSRLQCGITLATSESLGGLVKNRDIQNPSSKISTE